MAGVAHAHPAFPVLGSGNSGSAGWGQSRLGSCGQAGLHNHSHVDQLVLGERMSKNPWDM